MAPAALQLERARKAPPSELATPWPGWLIPSHQPGPCSYQPVSSTLISTSASFLVRAAWWSLEKGSECPRVTRQDLSTPFSLPPRQEPGWAPWGAGSCLGAQPTPPGSPEARRGVSRLPRHKPQPTSTPAPRAGQGSPNSLPRWKMTLPCALPQERS